MNLIKNLTVCLSLIASFAMSAAEPHPLSTNLGPIDLYWESDRYTGYDLFGKPLNVTNINDQLPLTFLADIYNRIPDGQRVAPDYVDTSARTNLIIDSDYEGLVTIDVTFLNEGAGYRNSFGYFIYDPAAPPETLADIDDHNIIFPNASKYNGGRLIQGDTVPLNVTLSAGQAMGFFIIPNGYTWGTIGNNAEIYDSGPWNQPFYSISSLNPEPEGRQDHNVVFYDDESELLVIGFEDVHRDQGDNDFNDLIFSLDVTPISAVEGIDENGDVENDTYVDLIAPPEPPPGSTTYYPSQSGYGTLMYEDLWPLMGDFDFNDLVVRYQYQVDLDYLGNVEAIQFTYQYQAIGAGYYNGFALHLPNVLKSNINSASITHNGVTTNVTPEAEATEVIFILSPDVWQEVSTQCPMFRTRKNCTDEITGEYVLNVEFVEVVDVTSIGTPPYDPFIFATQGKYHGEFAGRGWEVHLKEFPGTSLFNTEWLGMYDDNTNGENNFVNSNNMPWAINIADTVSHPTEGIDIQASYPDFADWAQSNGQESNSWYHRVNAILDYIFD